MLGRVLLVFFLGQVDFTFASDPLHAPDRKPENPQSEIMAKRHKTAESIDNRVRAEIAAWSLYELGKNQEKSNPYLEREEAIRLLGMRLGVERGMSPREANTRAGELVWAYRYFRTPDALRDPKEILDSGLQKLASVNPSHVIEPSSLIEHFFGDVTVLRQLETYHAIKRLTNLTARPDKSVPESFLGKPIAEWDDPETRASVRDSLLFLLGRPKGREAVREWYEKMTGNSLGSDIETLLNTNPSVTTSVLVKEIFLRVNEQTKRLRNSDIDISPRIIDNRPIESIADEMIRNALWRVKGHLPTEEKLKEFIQKQYDGPDAKAHALAVGYAKEERFKLHRERTLRETEAGLKALQLTLDYLAPNDERARTLSIVAEGHGNMLSLIPKLDFESFPVESTASLYAAIFEIGVRFYRLKNPAKSEADLVREHLRIIQKQIDLLDAKVATGFRDTKGELAFLRSAIQSELRSLHASLDSKAEHQLESLRAAQLFTDRQSLMQRCQAYEIQTMMRKGSDQRFQNHCTILLSHERALDNPAAKYDFPAHLFIEQMAQIRSETYGPPLSGEISAPAYQHLTDLKDLDYALGSSVQSPRDRMNINLQRMRSLGISLPSLPNDSALPVMSLLLAREAQYIGFYERFSHPNRKDYTRTFHDPEGAELRNSITINDRVRRQFTEISAPDSSNRINSSHVLHNTERYREQLHEMLDRFDQKLLGAIGTESNTLNGYDITKPIELQPIGASPIPVRELLPDGTIPPCSHEAAQNPLLKPLPVDADFLKALATRPLSTSVPGKEEEMIPRWMRTARAYFGGEITLCYEKVAPVETRSEFTRRKQEGHNLWNLAHIWTAPFAMEKTTGEKDTGGINEMVEAKLGIRLTAKLRLPNNVIHESSRIVTFPQWIAWESREYEPVFTDRDLGLGGTELDLKHTTAESRAVVEAANDFNQKEGARLGFGRFIGYRYLGEPKRTGEEQKHTQLSELWKSTPNLNRHLMQSTDAQSPLERSILERLVGMEVKQDVMAKVSSLLSTQINEELKGSANRPTGLFHDNYVTFKGSRTGLIEAIELMTLDGYSQDKKLFEALIALPDAESVLAELLEKTSQLTNTPNPSNLALTASIRQSADEKLRNLLLHLTDPNFSHPAPVLKGLEQRRKQLLGLYENRFGKLPEQETYNATDPNQIARQNDFIYELLANREGKEFPISLLPEARAKFQDKFGRNIPTLNETKQFAHEIVDSHFRRLREEEEARVAAFVSQKNRLTSHWESQASKLAIVDVESNLATGHSLRRQMQEHGIAETRDHTNLADAKILAALGTIEQEGKVLKETYARFQKLHHSLASAADSSALQTANEQLSLLQDEMLSSQARIETKLKQIEEQRDYAIAKLKEWEARRHASEMARRQPRNIRGDK